MPTYSYVCTVCEHRFDAVQSFVDPALTACPECAGSLRKLFGSVGVVFKGPGFYRTDARAGNGRNGKPAKTASLPASTPVTTGASSSSSGSSTGSTGSTGDSSRGASSTSGSNAAAPAASASA